MTEEKPKYESGIYGKAEARFGGKIFVDVVRFTGRDGVERHGITLSEFYNGGEVGRPPVDQRLHDPQISLVFDNMKSVEMVELALATVREMMKRDAEKAEVEAAPAEPIDEEVQKYFDLYRKRIVDCGFSVRVLSGLESAGIKTLGDICMLNKTDLLKIRNFGKHSLVEVDDYLKDNGLMFGTDVDGFMRKYIKEEKR